MTKLHFNYIFLYYTKNFRSPLLRLYKAFYCKFNINYINYTDFSGTLFPFWGRRGAKVLLRERLNADNL